MAKRKNYLNNKELLAEIHKSKCTFCSFVRSEYADYDGIATSRDEIDEHFIQEVKEKRADRDTKERKQELRDQGYKSPKVDYTPEDYSTEGLIIRVMEHEHIPYDPERAKKAKKPLDEKVKCIFPPFKHYYVYNDLTLEEVGRSHWKGSISNGYFSQDHGYTTDRLASMYMQLVERYSQRGNWRGYTYLDEMKSQALFQLAQIGLQFDESRSAVPNPFAYYTAAITNSFTRILNIEKKNQNIRDDILEMNNVNPSYTRQNENDKKDRGGSSS